MQIVKKLDKFLSINVPSLVKIILVALKHYFPNQPERNNLPGGRRELLV